jgi:phosphoenolpyruvate carboxykinase (ATP)
MYHFLSGYTSKIAGTEQGIKEPQASFSSCFGEAFLPFHPNTYATLLAEKIKKHGANTWLLNTGWIGGRYGVGKVNNGPYFRGLALLIRGRLLMPFMTAHWRRPL